jgi:hypothetical protein
VSEGPDSVGWGDESPSSLPMNLFKAPNMLRDCDWLVCCERVQIIMRIKAASAKVESEDTSMPRISRIVTRYQNLVEHLTSNTLSFLEAVGIFFTCIFSSNETEHTLFVTNDTGGQISTFPGPYWESLFLETDGKLRRHATSTQIFTHHENRTRQVAATSRCAVACHVLNGKMCSPKILPRCGYLKVQLLCRHHGCNPRCLTTFHRKNRAFPGSPHRMTLFGFSGYQTQSRSCRA